MSETPGPYQRSFAGMVGAMVVLLTVIAAFVVFRDLGRNTPESAVEPVDYAAPADYARDNAPFPVLAPEELPDGWIATSVRFRGGSEPTWHLGMLTDERSYVGLEQAPLPAEEMVTEFVDEDATARGTVRYDGQRWESFTDSGGDLALVREGPEVTTLIVGRVPQDTLERLLDTLA